MEEYSDKESYEGYFTKIRLAMADRWDKGIVKLKSKGVDVAGMPERHLWAEEYVPELRKEEKDLCKKISLLMEAGGRMAVFADDHFRDYQAVVREWGNVTNKIFNPFFKFLEESRDQEETVVEEEPAQVEMTV